MPTKPVSTPEQWATAGAYPASNYPATYPWGDAHPDAGLPTPWSGQPRVNATGLAGFAAQGAVPLEPQAGDLWNEEFSRVVELTRWVFLGSSNADENAHVVESDSTGIVSGYRVQAGGGVAATDGDALIAQGSGSNGSGVIGVGVGTGRGGFFLATGTNNPLKAEGDNGQAVIYAMATGGNTTGLLAEGAGSGPAVDALGSPTGLAVLATADAASALPAVRGLGAAGNANSAGIEGTAGDVGAVGVRGSTAAGSTEFAGNGVRGSGLGQGQGVWATSEDSWALYVVGDLSSPRRSSIRCVGQDADPSSPLAGGLGFNATRNAWRVVDNGGLRSVHTSPKGRVFNWGSTSSGGPIAGGSGDISTVQITPEETGDVLLTVTATLNWSLSTGSCNVIIRDVTGVVNITTVQEPSPDRDGVNPESRSIAIRANYTLPDTATRTFSVQVVAVTGNISWANLILSVEGVR